jgi:hypothetical protein
MAGMAAGRRFGCTQFMVLLYMLGDAVRRLYGQETMGIQVPVANRAYTGLVGTVGWFAHSIFVRLDLSVRAGVGGDLTSVRRDTLRSLKLQEMPYTLLIRGLNPGLYGHLKTIQRITLAMNVRPVRSPVRVADLAVDPFESLPHYSLPGSIYVNADYGEDLVLTTVFDAQTFTRDTVRGLLSAMRESLQSLGRS